jgi:hypothetical protein
MKVLLIALLITVTLSLKSQCNYHKDTLKRWLVTLTKPNYKRVKIIECFEVVEFDRLCKGVTIGYLTLFKQPLFMDDYYILHMSTTKIIL